MDEHLYWNDFYSKEKIGGIELQLPSQFAVFVATEYPNIRNVLEFGFGSGRDSFFFIGNGASYLGFDSSEAEVSACQSRLTESLGARAEFQVSDLSSNSWGAPVRRFIASKGDGDVMVYARFFIHAIDDEAEDYIISRLGELTTRGTVLALEFRTMKDSQLPKNTMPHYRRYVDPLKLMGRAINSGFDLSYFVEGFGYAKWGVDDAHVARCIFTKK